MIASDIVTFPAILSLSTESCLKLSKIAVLFVVAIQIIKASTEELWSYIDTAG